MLNYNQFKAALKEAIQNAFGYDYEVKEGTIVKANLGEVDCININRNDSKFGCVIYPSQRYEDYKMGRFSVDEFAAKMYEEQTADVENALDGAKDDLLSADYARSKVYYKMVGITGNEAYLKDIPYIVPAGFDDIALIPTIPVEFGSRQGGVTVHRENLLGWNMTESELHAAASANTEKLVTIRPLSDVLSEMMAGGLPMGFESPFHVSSSDPRYDASPLGAPKVMESVFAELGEHFVIPSSVHEMLFLPKSFETDPERLKSLVREVNTEVLEPQDRLSDSIYECKGPGMYVTHRSEEFMGAGDSDKATNDFHL